MNRALIYATLTIVLLLTSFQVHSQSENDLPSCMGYEFTALQETRAITLVDHYAELLDISGDTSNAERFINRNRLWAVFAHLDYWNIEVEGVRVEVEMAECTEYVEFDTLFLAIINDVYAMYSQYTLIQTLPGDGGEVADLFSLTIASLGDKLVDMETAIRALAEVTSD